MGWLYIITQAFNAQRRCDYLDKLFALNTAEDAFERIEFECKKTVVQRCSVKKLFLEISQNSQEIRLCQSLFFNKVEGLRPATLLKKRL